MDKGGNSSSSAIDRSSTNRKRKKSEQPAAKWDVVVLDDDRDRRRRLLSEGIFSNWNDVPVPILIEALFNLLSHGTGDPSFFTRHVFKILYGHILYQIVNSIEKKDPIREKICGKIWDDFFDFYDDVSVPEQALYSLRAYPNFLEWLNERETVTDCRGKTIEQMLELLNRSIIIQDDDYTGFPWRKKPKRKVYDSPKQLFCMLRPYSSFLKWLQEDEEEEEEEDKWLNYNEPQKVRARLIKSMFKFFGDEDFIARVGVCVPKVLDIVHGLVLIFQSQHEKELPAEKKQEPAEKRQEPAEKNQTSTSTANPNTPNPILEDLSEDDRMLLKRFDRKYEDIPLLVFHDYRKYHKQCMASKGFNFDTFPGNFNHVTPISPVGLYDSQLGNIDFDKLSEFAANEKYGEGKIKFEKVVRVNVSRSFYASCYYITFLGLYERSPYQFKALVKGTWKGVKAEEAYEVVSFSMESIAHSAKRVTRSSAKSALESELKVDKPKDTRRSSRSITQGSESKGTKEKASEGDYSNHNCEKHREDLSLIKSFIDMPDDDLLQKIQRSTNAPPPIKELRKYFNEVSESEGFHIGKYPGFFPIVTSIIRPVKWALWALDFNLFDKLARLAIESYNNENRSWFGFDSITEVNVSERMHYHFYITFFAHAGDDAAAAAAAETFQALVLVNMALRRNYQVHFCRIATK